MGLKQIRIILLVLLIVFALAYFIILYLYGDPGNSQYLGSVLLNSDSILITAIITIIVGLLFGEFYTTHLRFQHLGIINAEPERKGRESNRNIMWLDRLRKGQKSIIIAEVTNSGWFITAWTDFRNELPTILAQVEEFKFLFLNPGSGSFKTRTADEKVSGESSGTKERMKEVLTKVRSFWTDSTLSPHTKKIAIYFYDGAPLSLVKVDDRIYFSIYLPAISDKEAPEMELKEEGSFCRNILKSLNEICSQDSINAGKCIRVDSVAGIDAMLAHINEQGTTTT
jgi:hypothetical protein